MPNLRIVAENIADSSILSASPRLATDVDNLKTQSKAKIGRTNIIDHTPTYNQEITLQFSGLKRISAIVLGRHTFPLGMIIRFVLYGDTGATEILYDTGDLEIGANDSENSRIPWGHFLWGAVPWGGDAQAEEFAPSSNYVHWVGGVAVQGAELLETTTGFNLTETTTSELLIETDGAEASEGFVGVDAVRVAKIFFTVPSGLQIDIGRLIVGDYIEPEKNMNYNHKLSWYEDSAQYRTEASTLRSDISLPIRKIEFALDTINKEDKTLLLDGMRYVGLRRDFYINMFPDSDSAEKEKDYSGIMKITKEPILSEYAPEIYKSKYVLEEV